MTETHKHDRRNDVMAHNREHPTEKICRICYVDIGKGYEYAKGKFSNNCEGCFKKQQERERNRPRLEKT